MRTGAARVRQACLRRLLYEGNTPPQPTGITSEMLGTHKCIRLARYTREAGIIRIKYGRLIKEAAVFYVSETKKGGVPRRIRGGGLAVTSQDPPRLVKTSVQALLLMEA